MRDHAPDDGTERKPLVVVYTNYRGETETRHLLPESIRYGSTDYHPQPQWLMEAVCLDRQARRTFALEDMAGAREVSRTRKGLEDLGAQISALHNVYATTTKDQATAIALSQLWQMLGASNQTQAVQSLRALIDNWPRN